MPYREKVMQWLETCVSGCEEGCPYEYKNLVYRVECKADLMRDVLVLLRDDGKPVPRPARLMTEEEVLSRPEGAVVWRECHLSNGQYELRPLVCNGKGCCGDFVLSVECKYDFGCRHYVRYWTNKPTDEQRKADWNESQGEGYQRT